METSKWQFLAISGSHALEPSCSVGWVWKPSLLQAYVGMKLEWVTWSAHIFMQNNRLQAADVGFRPLCPGCRSFWYQSKSTRQSATSTLHRPPVLHFQSSSSMAHVRETRARISTASGRKSARVSIFFWEIPTYLQVPPAATTRCKGATATIWQQEQKEVFCL